MVWAMEAESHRGIFDVFGREETDDAKTISTSVSKIVWIKQWSGCHSAQVGSESESVVGLGLYDGDIVTLHF
jgi:hypothetical protein